MMDMQGIRVVECDVLVIGGGFAGAWAALRAAETVEGLSVTLVDKAFVSRSGASTMSGGVTTCPLDEDNLDEWAEEFIVRGSYMCDEAWTYQLLEGQRRRIKDYVDWGVPITRAEDGSIQRFASRGMVKVRCMQYSPKHAMRELRRRMLEHKVQILDRIFITELLTADGQWPTKAGIVGAVGFHVHTGEFVVLRAKRTVLAAGVMAMKGKATVDNDTGDGVAMAYRAGARLVDMEFSYGGTFQVLLKRFTFPSYNVAIAHGARLINSQGERFMERYDPLRLERSELSRVIAAFAREMIDGRGPVYVDLRHVDETYWRDLDELHPDLALVMRTELPDPAINPILIEPTWGLWSNARSGLAIDIACRTTLPGLLAAGACAKNDATGTHSSAGIPTAFAKVSGYIAGEEAALESREMQLPPLPQHAIMELRARALDPLGRPPSTATADALHSRLMHLESSTLDGLSFNERKLLAFEKVANDVLLEWESAPAVDLHDLVKLHEARNVAENAVLAYRSALDRTESREEFFREDYPEMNEAWFCWHGVQRGAGGPEFDRVPIPLEKARFKPSAPQRGLGAISAIMSGLYDPAEFV